jgi:glycerophosphoryl diester phosphodiesterase
MLNQKSEMRNLLLAGHRGASAHEPENTIRSFRAAVDLGANAVELDIRATKNGKLVVIHDSKVNRTTNGKGRVSKMTLSEIRKLDAGMEELIPTLEEAVAWAKGRATLLVEFKEPGLEARAVKIFRGKKDILAISFFQTVLEELKCLDPRIKTGLLFDSKPRHLDEFLSACQQLKISWILGKVKLINRKLVDKAHEKGLKVLAWTIDRPKALAKKIALGLDGVTSNRPEIFEGLSNKR